MMDEVSKRPGATRWPLFHFARAGAARVRGRRALMAEGSDGGGMARGDVLAVAEALYRDAAVELYRVIDALRAGELGEVKAAQDAIRSLRATALHVLDERGKVDKLRKQIAGQVGAGDALDLDGARAEIGRRLACLRDAGGSG